MSEKEQEVLRRLGITPEKWVAGAEMLLALIKSVMRDCNQCSLFENTVCTCEDTIDRINAIELDISKPWPEVRQIWQEMMG